MRKSDLLDKLESGLEPSIYVVPVSERHDHDIVQDETMTERINLA